MSEENDKKISEKRIERTAFRRNYTGKVQKL